MRVALALESSGPGGAEKVLLELAEGLRAAGDEPVLFSQRPGWLTEGAQARGIPVELVPQREGLDPLWVPVFARRLRRGRFELLHSHEFLMNVYGGAAARLAGLPTLATVHGHTWIADHPRRPLAYRVLRRAGMRIATVSHELTGYLSSVLAIPRDQIDVVHNGIPVPPRLPDAARAEARRALPLPADGPLVLAVGNLYPVKDHATLLRAVARLPSVQVAIAGRGAEEAPLRSLAVELRIDARVHLLGLRDDVGPILVAADVLAHPSREEGLPMAILEAMAAARPVVASAVGGIGEAVLDGETGILVPAQDPEALAAALARVLESPALRDRLGAAGHARAQAEFSREQMTARYRALFAQLRAGRAGPSASTSR